LIHHRPTPAVTLGFILLFGTFSTNVSGQLLARLDDVVVTASRTPEPRSESLASTTVIDRDEIETTQAKSVQDLLRGVAGLGIANSGGPGKATSVFLRGTNSDHVLVLVDGIKVGSATAGLAALQDMPAEQIERIEIVRGPRSSLYGSEAIGGVIQIFTRRGAGPAAPHARAGIGSHGQREVGVGVSGAGVNGGADTWYALDADWLDTHGIDACRGLPFPPGGGCFTDQPDRDGYRRGSIAARLGTRFGGGNELEVNLLRSAGHNEFDGSFVDESDFVQQVLGAQLALRPTTAWTSRLSLGEARDESNNLRDGNLRSRFDTRRRSAGWINEVSLADGHGVVAGVDHQIERVDSSTAYVVRSRTDTGVFAQYLADFGAPQLQLSLRRDDDEQFGRHTTGGVAAGYRFGPRLRATASHGTAFKAPTFNQLYYPGYGNADLRPERSRSSEFALSGSMGATDWNVAAFRTDVRDLIAGFPVANVDRARIDGAEASLATQVAGWRISANATLLSPKNRDTGALLPRRARRMANLDVQRDAGPWRLGATLHTEGQRYDDVANTVPLGGYTAVDLRAEYRLTSAWRVQARIANLFDRRFETAHLFNQPGRELFVTLRWQPVR